MKCPRCKQQTQVLDSRERDQYQHRRRECTHCGDRFSTHEIPITHLEARFFKRLVELVIKHRQSGVELRKSLHREISELKL